MKHERFNKNTITLDDLFCSSGTVNAAIIRRDWFKQSKLYDDIMQSTQQYDDYKLTLGQRIQIYAKKSLPLKCPYCGKIYFKFKGYPRLYKICNCHINYTEQSKFKFRNNRKQTKIKLLTQLQQDLRSNTPPKYSIDYIKQMEFDDQHFKISFSQYDLCYSILYYTNSYIPVTGTNYNATERVYIIKNNISLDNYEEILKTKKFMGYKIGFDIPNKLQKQREHILKCIEEQGFEIVDKQQALTAKSLPRCTVRCKKCGKILNPLTKCGLWKRIHCDGCYGNNQRSKIEDEIITYIREISPNITIHKNYNNILNNSMKELDIYLPELNIGIEIDGLLWHSFGYKYPNNMEVYNIHKYHIYDKFLDAKNNGIMLFNILDSEWMHNTDYIKYLLRFYITNNSVSIQENCDIRQLTYEQIQQFYNYNKIPSIVNIDEKYFGLIHDNNIIATICVNSEYMHDLWFAIDCNANHDINKLLLYIYNNLHVYKYIHNSRFILNESIVNSLFLPAKFTQPHIFYTKDCEHIYDEQTAPQLINNYDNSKSLMDNMLLNGYRQFLDCGDCICIHIDHFK